MGTRENRGVSLISPWQRKPTWPSVEPLGSDHSTCWDEMHNDLQIIGSTQPNESDAVSRQAQTSSGKNRASCNNFLLVSSG